jgi:4-amino-4-deoxy-L-arabinose transferase-like glycosyltransferase
MIACDNGLAKSVTMRGTPAPSCSFAWRHRGVLALVLALYFTLGCFKLGFSDVGVDEGRFGICALNILNDIHQLATVSEDPAGPVGTKPPLFPLSVAASFALLGKTEFALRLANVVFLALSGLLLCACVQLLFQDSVLSLLSAALFLFNPGTLTYARIAMPEALVVLGGCLAVVAVLKARTGPWPPWGLLCGLALGCAFLSKLWLVFPFVMAVGWIWLCAGPRPWRRALAFAAVALFSFLLTASSHYLLIRLWTPADADAWKDIYYLFSLRSRVAGTNYDPAMWFHPWWYYSGAVFKACFFALPFVFSGAVLLLKCREWLATGMIVALLSPVLLLSFFEVKQATYIFPAIPALMLLAALGIRKSLAGWTSDFPYSLVAAVLISIFFLARNVIRPAEAAVITVLYGLLGVSVLLARKNRRMAVAAVSAMLIACVGTADFVVVRKNLYRTYYREIAELFKDDLSSVPVRQLAFIAPEFAAMEFYTYRTGQYWATYYMQTSASSLEEHLERRDIVFYLVDRNQQMYGGKITPLQLEMLRRNTTDKTIEFERRLGHKLDVAVLVPRKQDKE